MEEKSFLFITPKTPLHLQSPLRKDLYEIFLKALKNQEYSNWKALIVGEEEAKDGNIIHKKHEGESKNSKINFAIEYIQGLERKPDYIIRLDDDDVINPWILKEASKRDFDCYGDQYHCFLDVVIQKTAKQKRDWLPNTVIHKYEHAMSLYEGGDARLINVEHTKWNDYYRNKHLVFSNPGMPVYCRVISPTTITSNQSMAPTVNWVDYKQYLKQFGKWRKQNTTFLEDYLEEFRKIGAKHGFYGKFPNSGESLLLRLKSLFH